MREFFDYSGQDDDYGVEYDAPVFVFDDEDQDSGSDYGSSDGGSDSAADNNEYVLEYVQDSRSPKGSDKSKRDKASKAAAAASSGAQAVGDTKAGSDAKSGAKAGSDAKSGAKAGSDAKSGAKAGVKSSGKSKKSHLQTPSEFEPEPAPPPPKPRSASNYDEDEELEPVFVFDEDLTDDDDYVPEPPVSRESVGGRSSENAQSKRDTRGDSGNDNDENEFVFMPFLDMKDEPDEDEGETVKLSFSKVKAQKKEKEFVFMPFLNISDETPDEESEADAKKPFLSSKGTIIDEGLVLRPLESPEEILEEDGSSGSGSTDEDTGISLVGGEQVPMDHVPKPKKKKSSSRKGGKQTDGKKRPSDRKRGGSETPDEQFRAAMKNIDPEILKSVRKDPIQMAALEQAVRIALVQQAAQAAVEKTTGRSFGYIGNYAPANTPGVMPSTMPGIMPGTAQTAPDSRKKKKSRSRSSGYSGGGIFNTVTEDIAAPSEFGIDAKEAASIKEMAAAYTPPQDQMSSVPVTPMQTFTPSPSAQQDPALAAMNAAAQADQPINPDSILPDVTQDPALASLKGTYGRPEDAQLPPGAAAPRSQPSSNKINLSSPAAVRAAMRSRNSVDQIQAQNAAKAKSSQAAEAASNSVESYDREAEESNRSGCLIWIIVLFIAFFIGLLAIAVWPAISKEMNYKNAYAALNEGRYAEAIEGFTALDDYKDSPQRNQEAVYMYGDLLYQNEDYEGALDNFLSIDPAYSDTSERIAQCRYALGTSLLAEGKYAEAYDQLYLIPKYQDAGELAMESNYKAAAQLRDEEMYERAAKRFELFPDYQDSKEQFNFCEYNYAKALFDADQYDLAYRAYSSVGGYQDAPYFAAIAQYDAIVTGSTYQPQDMQIALNTLSAYSNNEDARTILQSHVYDIAKLIGKWQTGTSSLTFEITEDGGSRLVTAFEGENEKTYENVVFDNGSVKTADGGAEILTISGFDPFTSNQPNTVSLRSSENGNDYVFTRR